MEGPPDPRTDRQLLIETRAEPEAFAVFYRRHVRGVLGFFRRRVPTTELAFDLCAETFAAALAAIPRYEPRSDSASGWLYGIARNKLHEAQRRSGAEDRVRRALGMAPIILTDEGLERLEQLAPGPALTLLETLPAGQREAVQAHIVDERPYGDIARELHCSPSVVRKRVSRGVRAMRAKLEASDE